MKITPLAFDSMGVRSMSCFIQGDRNILVDPGVSLAPHRSGLPPHQRELEQLAKKRKIINEKGEKAHIIIISHWHNDRHTPFTTELYGSVTLQMASRLYQGKSIFGKSLSGLNYMQKRRALSFLDYCSFTPADGLSFSYGDMKITFSQSVPHGAAHRIPVIMVVIEGERKILHASDTQGISGIQYILQESPDLVLMSGPPVYRMSSEQIQRAQSDILALADCTGEIILDHHHLRDLKYREQLPEVWKNTKVKTAAEYLGHPNLLLEARRRELFREQCPHL
ncbi:MAG: MBL fold metallo-hydrolase [Theionarchaea archaeon]|nr:MBL fold metallo-hydrolase [Theionarchaea archaeon]